MLVSLPTASVEPLRPMGFYLCEVNTTYTPKQDTQQYLCVICSCRSKKLDWFEDWVFYVDASVNHTPFHRSISKHELAQLGVFFISVCASNTHQWTSTINTHDILINKHCQLVETKLHCKREGSFMIRFQGLTRLDSSPFLARGP